MGRERRDCSLDPLWLLSLLCCLGLLFPGNGSGNDVVKGVRQNLCGEHLRWEHWALIFVCFQVAHPDCVENGVSCDLSKNGVFLVKFISSVQ